MVTTSTRFLRDMTAVTTGFDSMDIILKGVDKWLWSLPSLSRVGASCFQMLAFGDNLNDMEMLTFAGACGCYGKCPP